jgi:tetratricopeptide (TPR) repeat protein
MPSGAGRVLLVACASVFAASALAAVDIDALWDFSTPAASEQRFRAALKDATPDEALILQTQIARTYGLRGDFGKAQEVLHALEPRLADAGSAARAYYWLELGRTNASAAHAPATQTKASRWDARAAYDKAIAAARAAKRDDLHVDALHMLAFVDTAPADQLNWTRQALAVAQASSQEPARRWAASLHNNIGYALHEQGRYAEALDEFQAALRLREARSNAEATRVARWMVAWTLRSLGRNDEALAMQLALEKEYASANAPSPDVYEELEALYAARGDAARAAQYRERRKALGASATP